MGFPGGSVVKNPPANAGDVGSISEWGRSAEEGNGNPFQYSCLGNGMDRGAWWATVSKRVRHNLATKQQQFKKKTTMYMYLLKILQKVPNRDLEPKQMRSCFSFPWVK